MMFDFSVTDEAKDSIYALQVEGQPTYFWKFVTDPKVPVRVTMDLQDVKTFDGKGEAEKFLDENNLDEKGFRVVELHINGG